METKDIEYYDIIGGELQCLGAGVSGHVFAIDDHTVVKVAQRTGNEYMDNELLESHMLERRVFERLGKHHRICELKYAINRGLVLERLVESLRDRLSNLQKRDQVPSVEEAFKWSIQAAEGSAYLHENGVIHYDMGSANLLLDRDDNIKICDFGVSSIDGSTPQGELDTDFQRPGKDDTVSDIQDDLFDLGSLIFEIWTGSTPSWSESSSDGQQGFPDLTRVLPAAVIMQCWNGHYQSATEIVTALEALQKETNACTSTQGETDSVIRRMTCFLTRKDRLALLTSAAVLTITVVGLLRRSSATTQPRPRQV
ncbi:hypothetical protein LTR41_009218 [Exophiala xenobiotica]|nr:hypothetical protein LTR41_009218 [Exophiala xenobiotica]